MPVERCEIYLTSWRGMLYFNYRGAISIPEQIYPIDYGFRDNLIRPLLVQLINILWAMKMVSFINLDSEMTIYTTSRERGLWLYWSLVKFIFKYLFFKILFNPSFCICERLTFKGSKSSTPNLDLLSLRNSVSFCACCWRFSCFWLSVNPSSFKVSSNFSNLESEWHSVIIIINIFLYSIIK